MITWICIGLINLITLSKCEFNNLTALDAPPDFLLPYCGFTQFKKKRPRVAFVSHDSAISTFYQNPEQGSRDAARIVDLDIEWNRYLFNSGARMAKDIDTAVKNGVDGIIASIPSDDVYHSIKKAVQANIPVIVFNSGLKYAESLGLTRILQNDEHAGSIMGEELKKRNCSKPLLVKMSSLEKATSEERILGLSHILGDPLSFIEIKETDNLASQINAVKNAVLASKESFDSIISLGGSASTNVVASIILDIKKSNPKSKLGAAFFDLGGSNMSALFEQDKNTFAISQLPYYQTALPVFYMYLKLLTGQDVYTNQTIETGPKVVTKDSLSSFLQSEQNSLISVITMNGSVGTLVTDMKGDTYNSAMMAGVYSLAQKLDWKVYNRNQDVLSVTYNSSKEEVTDYFDNGMDGIILKTSDHELLEYASNMSKDTQVPVVAVSTFLDSYKKEFPYLSNVGVNISHLAQSIAESVISDDRKQPLCLADMSLGSKSDFCNLFYDAYKSRVSYPPDSNNIIHYINYTYPGAMEAEFLQIENTLRKKNYIPDSFITISERIFNVINNRILKEYLSSNTSVYTVGEIFDQDVAFMEGRATSIWAINLFALGFLSLLHIAINKLVKSSFRGETYISTPRIFDLCPAGSYFSNLTTSAYCQDTNGEIQRSVYCTPCPENTFANYSNAAQCLPCNYGFYAPIGSSSCISCHNETPDHMVSSTCSEFIGGQGENRKQIFLAVFIPVGVVLLLGTLGLLFYFYKKRKSQEFSIGNDESWLLSFRDLIKPPMQHYDSGNSYQRKYSKDVFFHTKGDGAELASKRNSQVDDWVSTEGTIIYPAGKSRTSTDVGLPKLDAVSETMLNSEQNSGTKTPEEEKTKLLHAVGNYCNLPVYIKQIGSKRIRIDKEIRKEVHLMKSTRHSKLTEFVGLIIEPERIFVVEEYCAKGSLANVLANPDFDLPWIFRFSLINDLISGMRFLHRSKFLFHGCLTSKNCMVTGRWELKISNYGLENIRDSQMEIVQKPMNEQSTSSDESFPGVARVLRSTKTLFWLAPESVVATPLNEYLTFPTRQADVFSAGIIINEILTREIPYKSETMNSQTPEQVFVRVCEGLRPNMLPPRQDEFTNDMNAIVSDCLLADSFARPSFSTIGDRIDEIDPYFGGSDSVIDIMATLLERYANDMESLVKKRTANLQQRTLELEEERARTDKLLKDLKSAKEIAEAAAKSKQSFLANMSHEIRTPMNAVIGMSRSLMESDLPPDLFECAETIESSGNHLMALIDDILDYSKIESGRLQLEKSALDLTYVIESAMKLLSTNYLGKGLTLWYTISPDVPNHVYGDLVRLRQILLNLLSNAFKFTQDGQVVVRVEIDTKYVYPENQGTSYFDERTLVCPGSPMSDGYLESITPNDSGSKIPYMISVTDSGIGISKENLVKLFKSFSQVDASTTRNFGGTGLGLAISRKLCKIMGGDMHVESKEGKGSTFFFRAMLEKQEESETYGEENHLSSIAEECSDILVVAQKENICFQWLSILSNMGIKNIQTRGYDEAVKLLDDAQVAAQNNPAEEKYPFSLIIVDVDFETIESFNMEENSTTSSEDILTHLQTEYPRLKTIPSICIVDSRSRHSKQHPRTDVNKDMSNCAIQHPQGSCEPMETPFDEAPDPFDCDDPVSLHSLEKALNRVNHAKLTKPFKNSKLIATLHTLITKNGAASATAIRRCYPSNEATANSSRHMSQQRVLTKKTKSSCSSGSRNMSASENPSTENLATIKTLIVDDNPVNQKVLSRMLSQIGLASTVAHNGKEAYNMYMESVETETPYELIFMDIWMPEMNGLEASEKIRSEQASTSTEPYIIALTACVMPGDKEKCTEAGMNGYVSKPIRKEELEASIHTFTQLRSK